VAGLAVYGVYIVEFQDGTVTSPVPSKFTVNGRTYTFTYVAITEAEREHGLMNTSVTDSTTMLFAFPSSQTWQFYMYDTNTSLDMIWISATGFAGKVVYVAADAQPCYLAPDKCPRFTPTGPANYVIEGKAGFAAANNVTSGVTIQFS
jgi:uncharacterized membrane protein (UPF0127 family)